uniref:Uncharacterized protein n=1 Tax=Solanum tuberosum TaxID=4113 RepID=M1D9U7_SOLTU
MDQRPRLSLNGRELDGFLKGGSNPPKKGRQKPPPGNKDKGKRPTSDRKTTIRDPNVPSWAWGFYAFVQAFLAETPLAAHSGSDTVVSFEETLGTKTHDKSDAPGTDAQTDGPTV